MKLSMKSAMDRMFTFVLVLYLGLFWMQSEGHAQTIVFKDVSVLTMESDEIQSGFAVVVRDGIIEWVGVAADVEVPEGASVVGEGLFLMPGLAEMHAHIPPASQGPDYVNDVLKMYVSQGITTIRGMLGEASHLELREKAARGEVVAPRIFTSGPSFNGNSAKDPEAAREMVRAQHAAGYDLLKLHPGLSVEVFDAIADEANKLGMDFSGHISHAVGLERTLASGKGTIDHLDRYMEFMAGDAAQRMDPTIIFFGYDLTPHIDSDKMTEAAQRTLESGVRIVPTNTLLENVFNPDNTIAIMQTWPGMDLMPANVKSGWINYISILRNQDNYDAELSRQFLAYRLELTKTLHDHGVEILLGADAPQIFNPPGYSAHKELELLVKAGLTPFEAITTGTINVGKYFNETDKTGKIATGFRADMILLDVNPLETIPFNGHIRGVVANGQYYDHEDFTSMTEQIRDRVNQD
ncbi:MAG TPA: amidohydrolase [Bacteroidetes bacterium]|nr:amidohydrolase [Bacteroidota bacterium]